MSDSDSDEDFVDLTQEDDDERPKAAKPKPAKKPAAAKKAKVAPKPKAAAKPKASPKAKAPPKAKAAPAPKAAPKAKSPPKKKAARRVDSEVVPPAPVERERKPAPPSDDWVADTPIGSLSYGWLECVQSLRDAKALYDEGILDEAEYKAKTKELLAGP